MPTLIFLCGTMGVGKTTLARAWRSSPNHTNRVHIEVDKIREEVRAETSNPMPGIVVEDSVNWRVYVLAMQALRAGYNTIIDSSGASSRHDYLRQALSEFPQVLVRLITVDPVGKCQAKHGNAIKHGQIKFYVDKVAQLQSDLDIYVDRTPLADQLALLESKI